MNSNGNALNEPLRAVCSLSTRGEVVQYKKHTREKVGTKALTLSDYFVIGLPENKGP